MKTSNLLIVLSVTSYLLFKGSQAVVISNAIKKQPAYQASFSEVKIGKPMLLPTFQYVRIEGGFATLQFGEQFFINQAPNLKNTRVWNYQVISDTLNITSSYDFFDTNSPNDYIITLPLVKAVTVAGSTLIIHEMNVPQLQLFISGIPQQQMKTSKGNSFVGNQKSTVHVKEGSIQNLSITTENQGIIVLNKGVTIQHLDLTVRKNGKFSAFGSTLGEVKTSLDSTAELTLQGRSLKYFMKAF
ncbi:MAG: DUF2807 domain-containing protein [Spirosomataceae bacterium]